MSVLANLDEKYDNVFFTFTKYIMYEKVTLDNTKTLLQSHECRLERYKFVAILHLFTVNMSVKNDMKASYDNQSITQMLLLESHNLVIKALILRITTSLLRITIINFMIMHNMEEVDDLGVIKAMKELSVVWKAWPHCVCLLVQISL